MSTISLFDTEVMAAKTTSTTPFRTMSECDAIPHGVSSTRHQHVPASTLFLPQALGENLDLALL